MSGLLSRTDNGLEPIPWQNEYQNYLYSNPGTIMFSIGRIGHGFIRGYFGTTSKLAALAHARECFGILQLNHYWRPISYRNRPSWLDQQAGLACATPLRQFDFRFTDDWNDEAKPRSGMRNSRDPLRSSRAWFDHSGLRYAQTSNPNHAVVRYAHSLDWVFPKWRVVSWRTRVREAHYAPHVRACTRMKGVPPKNEGPPRTRNGILAKNLKISKKKVQKTNFRGHCTPSP